jgi:hypothetical protein
VKAAINNLIALQNGAPLRGIVLSKIDGVRLIGFTRFRRFAATLYPYVARERRDSGLSNRKPILAFIPTDFVDSKIFLAVKDYVAVLIQERERKVPGSMFQSPDFR